MLFPTNNADFTGRLWDEKWVERLEGVVKNLQTPNAPSTLLHSAGPLPPKLGSYGWHSCLWVLTTGWCYFPIRSFLSLDITCPSSDGLGTTWDANAFQVGFLSHGALLCTQGWCAQLCSACNDSSDPHACYLYAVVFVCDVSMKGFLFFELQFWWDGKLWPTSFS